MNRDGDVNKEEGRGQRESGILRILSIFFRCVSHSLSLFLGFLFGLASVAYMIVFLAKYAEEGVLLPSAYVAALLVSFAFVSCFRVLLCLFACLFCRPFLATMFFELDS